MDSEIIKYKGFLLVDKPPGPTSHDIINRLRIMTGIRKIGHAGTLDPFASGLLIIAIGREATREISRFVKLDKVYIAELRLGAVSDTYDRTGKIELKIKNEELKIGDIRNCLKRFVGMQEQVPPMYSAKKVKGKKLYELARKGIEIERAPAEIEIYSIRLIEYDWPLLKIEVHCSSGTYIRALAHEIGALVGCGAYLNELRRIKIGQYDIKDAIDPTQIKDKQEIMRKFFL